MARQKRKKTRAEKIAEGTQPPTKSKYRIKREQKAREAAAERRHNPNPHDRYNWRER